MSSVPFRSALILLPGEASPQAHLSVPQASGPAFSFLPSGSVFVGLSRGQRWGSARPQKPSRRVSRWGTETPLITVLSPGARRPPAPGPQASPSCPSRLSLSSPHSCHLQGPPWLTTKSDLLFMRCIAFLVAPQPQITATVCFLPTAALGVCCTPPHPCHSHTLQGTGLGGVSQSLQNARILHQHISQTRPGWRLRCRHLQRAAGRGSRRGGSDPGNEDRCEDRCGPGPQQKQSRGLEMLTWQVLAGVAIRLGKIALKKRKEKYFISEKLIPWILKCNFLENRWNISLNSSRNSVSLMSIMFDIDRVLGNLYLFWFCNFSKFSF